MIACREDVIAVIGGGRWARVIISVLAQMTLPFERLVIVSRSNSEAMRHFIENQLFASSLSFEVVSSLDALLENYNVKAAIVANEARQHFDVSSHLIDRGVNVLIEKPAVLSTEHAQILLEKAKSKGVCLIPGLQYRFCSYIHDFAHEFARLEKIPLSFSIEWSDQMGEVRYGETKTYDSSIDVAQDVMPHIWAILSVIFKGLPVHIDSCLNASGSRYGKFLVSRQDGVEGEIILQRDAVQRKRLIDINFSSNESLSMDFSCEPGTIYWNEKIISTNLNWDTKPKPLASQLHYFFSTIRKGFTTESDIRASLDSVSFLEHASGLLTAEN